MIIILNILFISSIFGTDLGNESYLWPLDDKNRKLTDVFGDFRSRRYHAGIDVRTKGLAYELYAISDGYIERIRVSSSGYGKTIYIRLNDDRIAVYAHLSEFTPPLNKLAKGLQEKANSYTINQILEPNKFIVKKGDLIGYTGDTGSIRGPHLHFEIRDKNNRPLNPLLTNYTIIDSIYPEAENFAIIPLEENSIVNGELKPIIITINKINNKEYKISKQINISGKFGLAIEIIDYMEPSKSSESKRFKYGLYGLEMYINNQKYYSIKYDNFDFDEGELVYTERDFALPYKGKGKVKYYRLFKNDKVNKLSFHEQGLKSLNNLSSGSHDLKIIAYDYNNNEIIIRGKLVLNTSQLEKKYATFSRENILINNICDSCEIHQFEHGTYISIPKIKFNISPSIQFITDKNKNKKIPIFESEDKENFNFIFNPTALGEIKGISFKLENQKLDYKLTAIPAIPGKSFNLNYENKIFVSGSGDTFYDTSLVWIKKIDLGSNIKKGELVEGPWEIGPDYIPYRNQIELEIKNFQMDKNSIENIAIYYLNKKNRAWYYMPTTYHSDNNVFTTSALSGEIFALIKESNPPEIKSLVPQSNEILYLKNNNILSFKIKDDLSGIDGERDIEIYINENRVIHEYNSYRKEVKYDLNEALEIGKNIAKIILKDRAGNSKIINGVWILKE